MAREPSKFRAGAERAVALFFDAAWFDARLAERSLSRPVLAAAAGLTPSELELVYKDQREVSADEVAVFAEMLGEPPEVVARHAGVSTPAPAGVEPDRLAGIEARLERIEALLRDLVKSVG